MKETAHRLLKEARIAAKITQQQAAAQIDVKKSTISNYETGVSEPSIDNLVKLCLYYKIEPAYFVNKAYDIPCGSDVLSPDAREVARKFLTLDRHGKEIVRQITDNEYRRVLQDQGWKKYIGKKIAARTGGVCTVDEAEAKELAELEQFLRGQNAL